MVSEWKKQRGNVSDKVRFLRYHPVSGKEFNLNKKRGRKEMADTEKMKMKSSVQTVIVLGIIFGLIIIAGIAFMLVPNEGKPALIYRMVLTILSCIAISAGIVAWIIKMRKSETEYNPNVKTFGGIAGIIVVFIVSMILTKDIYLDLSEGPVTKRVNCTYYTLISHPYKKGNIFNGLKYDLSVDGINVYCGNYAKTEEALKGKTSATIRYYERTGILYDIY